MGFMAESEVLDNNTKLGAGPRRHMTQMRTDTAQINDMRYFAPPAGRPGSFVECRTTRPHFDFETALKPESHHFS
jgi:hypothetical protein